MPADIGMCFDRSFPADAVGDYAQRLEAAGLDQLWLIEDCFFTAGVSLAATALASSGDLQVGIGIMPAVARNPAITAMEIATLANIAPGRFRPGIGHGVQEWMAQIGARPASPLTALDETMSVIRRLLAGDHVSFDGEYVHLAEVQLDQPPSQVPALLAGVQQAKSMALAGRVADGVILVEGVGPTYVNWALDQAGRPADFEVVTFTMMAVEDDRRDAYAILAPVVAGLINERKPSLTVLPFFDEIATRVASEGAEALVEMPADYWAEIGAIGTMDDAVAHVVALEAAGAGSINVFPGPELSIAHEQIAEVALLSAQRS